MTPALSLVLNGFPTLLRVRLFGCTICRPWVALQPRIKTSTIQQAKWSSLVQILSFFPGKTCIRRCMTQLCQPYSGRPLCCNFFVRWAAEQGWTSFEFVFILIVFDRKRHWQLPLQESTTCDAQVTGKFWPVLRPTLPQPALYANSCSWE